MKLQDLIKRLQFQYYLNLAFIVIISIFPPIFIVTNGLYNIFPNDQWIPAVMFSGGALLTFAIGQAIYHWRLSQAPREISFDAKAFRYSRALYNHITTTAGAYAFALMGALLSGMHYLPILVAVAALGWMAMIRPSEAHARRTVFGENFSE